MQVSFDIYNQSERPSIVLCNPDGEQLYSLESAYNVKPTLRFNAQSEIEFDFPKYIDGVELPGFEYLQSKRLVLLDGIGYFVIVDPEKSDDGGTPIKHIKGFSRESELVFKKINTLSGTYKLYDTDDPTNTDTLVGLILFYAPNWSVSSIDSTLVDLYRTFNVTDTNLYQFLTADASTAYNCFFIFDFLNRSIKILDIERDITATDVYLSFDNLIKDQDYNEISEEIVTALYCYGGGNLTIRNVNPLGTNVIYDFSYYKNSNWMSQDLIDAITAWENKIELYKTDYFAYSVLLTDYQTELATEQTTLVELQTQLTVYQQTYDVRTEQGLDTTEIEELIEEQKILINNQNLVIINIQNNISSTALIMSNINTELSFTNTSNFTTEQYLKLSNFIYENTYKNENIIITSLMSNAEINAQSLELYNTSSLVLSKMAVPRYQITLNTINFPTIAEFSSITGQFVLGDQITIETDENLLLSATLLEYSFNYEDPTDFSIIISNKQRINNSSFIFSDYIQKTLKIASDVSFTKDAYNDWSTNKPIIIDNVVTPSGISSYGIVGENIKGEITATPTLNITNINSTTGSSNFILNQEGVILREPTIYTIDSGVGISRDVVTAGGGVISFRNGVFISGSGLAEGSSLTIREDLTGQSGSYIYISGSYITNSSRIYVNGITQIKGVHYNESPSSGATMIDEIQVGDGVLFEYVPLIT